MGNNKFKSEKEIIRLTMLERALRPDDIDKRYQVVLRNVAEKNQKYLNYVQKPMVDFDVKNLITCYNNQLIDIEDFKIRIEKLVAYNIMFEEIKIQDEK